MDPACQVGTIQRHGGSIMVWGVFSWLCLGSSVHVPTPLNAIRYAELLGGSLHPLMLFCYPHSNGVFQQDNCTSHKSQLSTGWLYEHSSNFSVTNWPLEQGVKGHHTEPTNVTDLRIALANIWQMIPMEHF
ncbi:transposable element Tcb2 transposase [Trichonephila clavipes]|nr:transposable element Tcb2 transposase [Trichonephila clavipes]